MTDFHATTILLVRKNEKTVMAGDGQVSFQNTILKGTARKVRRLYQNQILAGFAGATADAFTLYERLESKLEQYSGHLTRASVELAKEWRTDRALRRLEAMLLVANTTESFLISGQGDVIEPEYGAIAIGSGGSYAYAAARALLETDLTAEEIAKKSMAIAADICVYTNHNLVLEVL